MLSDQVIPLSYRKFFRKHKMCVLSAQRLSDTPQSGTIFGWRMDGTFFGRTLLLELRGGNLLPLSIYNWTYHIDQDKLSDFTWEEGEKFPLKVEEQVISVVLETVTASDELTLFKEYLNREKRIKEHTGSS